MSKLYDYLITFYKVLVGLVTTQRLIYIAIGCLAFYLLWVIFSLSTCFQRKFSKKCDKLTAFVKANEMSHDKLKIADMMAQNISSGFYHGWKKLKTTTSARPSDIITRREALEVEINGGVLNQGKTFMRSFIYVTTIILFMFNFAYLGTDKEITSYVIAEAMMLPLVYFILIKLFYFLYTSVKQQLYKHCVQSFYDLVAELDNVFGIVEAFETKPAPVTQDNQTITSFADTSPAIEPEQEMQEEQDEVFEDEIIEPTKNTLDRYDVFKKKNIDVDRLINEVPQGSGTNLPYINVDSDYVIKDDEKVARQFQKIVTENDTASSILGGMMQDRANLKKNNANFLDVDKDIAEFDDKKIEETNLKGVETNSDEQPVTEEILASDDAVSVENSGVIDFDNFEVNSQAEEPASEEIKAAETLEETEEVAEDETYEETEAQEAEVQEYDAVQAPEESVSEVVEDNSDFESQDAIANLVSGFKPHRSKLASGGVEIEMNTPLPKRDQTGYMQGGLNEFEQQNYASNSVKHLSAETNAEDILNSIKNSTVGYDNSYPSQYNAPSYVNPAMEQGYGYNQQGYPAFNQGYAPNYGYNGYAQAPTNMGVQNPYNQNFDAYNASGEDAGFVAEEVQEIADQEDNFEEPAEETPAKVVKKPKAEPKKSRNTSKRVGDKVQENVKTTKTRGRPKKQEVSETMVIANEAEFNDVLARAEKLMRKSEEGLSASQSKRIEKELKLLMDAMNRYKESN